MNFLAHLYLSGKEEDVIVGNFVADAIKGNSLQRFPEGMERGIRLHREIDHYTDQHPVFKASRSRLVPRYRMYAGVIVDLYYDHVLARYWDEYSDEDLAQLVARTYFLLIRRFHLLPPRSRRILPFMITQNWLVGYRDLHVLQRVFNGMSRRTSHQSGMENAIHDLQAGYDLFESEFRAFFPEIIRHIDQYRSNLQAGSSSL
ncbi:MAG: ACP phosphodiesterase [Bacteroidales bacterium]|nr:ACP phosphodiesterase [Bacteroidales bacterium]